MAPQLLLRPCHQLQQTRQPRLVLQALRGGVVMGKGKEIMKIKFTDLEQGDMNDFRKISRHHEEDGGD